MKKTARKASVLVLILLCQLLAAGAPQSPAGDSPAARIVGEVLTGGRQMRYPSLLSDEIGSRLTGSKGAERAVQAMEAEMKQVGLAGVQREPFKIPISWERGQARASLFSFGDRPLTLASYTWTPATTGPALGPVMDVGAGRSEDIEQLRGQLKGAIALAATAYAIADRPDRFGRRLTVEEVRKVAVETKVGAQWRAAGIWPLN